MGQLSIQNVLRHMFAHNCFHVVRLCALKNFFFYLLILEKGKDREREREREGNINFVVSLTYAFFG